MLPSSIRQRSIPAHSRATPDTPLLTRGPRIDDVDVPAYFLTFGTYGSRLHGDERGSWDRQSGWSEVPRSSNPILVDYETRRLVQRAVVITPAMRSVIERSVVEVCEHRNWALLALNVRLEHIHAVVVAEGFKPERVANDFKTYATRRMREALVVDAGSRLWARHASTHYLFDDNDVEMAVDYTMNHQGARLPGSSWRRRDKS